MEHKHLTFEEFLKEKFLKIHPNWHSLVFEDRFRDWLRDDFDTKQWLMYGEAYGLSLLETMMSLMGKIDDSVMKQNDMNGITPHGFSSE